MARIEPGKVDWFGVLASESSGRVAYAHCKLLCPDLVAYRGGIFLADRFSEANVDEWMDMPGLGTRDVERLVNHLHLVEDVLPRTQSEELACIRVLADMIAFSWPVWAYRTYGWRIDVEIVETDAPDFEVSLLSVPLAAN
jgi:hypothetical protein